MLKKAMLLVLALLVIATMSFPAGRRKRQVKPHRRKYDEYKLKATVESTGGSVFNVNAIMAGNSHPGR